MAIVQSHATADIKGNSRHICELMTQDRDVGAGLIHLPEAALSGYVKSKIPNRGSVDWEEVEDGRINIRETARQLEIRTVVGCNHRMARPNQPRNSLFVISDRGKLITSYDKRYCLKATSQIGIRLAITQTYFRLMVSGSTAHFVLKFSFPKYSGSMNN